MTPLRLRVLSASPLFPPSSVRFRQTGTDREPGCTYGAYCTMRQVLLRVKRSKNESAAPTYGTSEFHHPEYTSRLANSVLYPARINFPDWITAFRSCRGCVTDSTPAPLTSAVLPFLNHAAGGRGCQRKSRNIGTKKRPYSVITS